ncbi:hypothetical protein Pcinc_031322 [Petrolisthes cinctipes]|uniref:Uncharacterized protein n=1 Tax=Petrolisthes cinctipes TaxID=88211 RepID=A0AAE1EWW8_PETCI|nr:hypothetical protein Pcinc_031322 [Petrolisthes cinctipes]
MTVRRVVEEEVVVGGAVRWVEEVVEGTVRWVEEGVEGTVRWVEEGTVRCGGVRSGAGVGVDVVTWEQVWVGVGWFRCGGMRNGQVWAWMGSHLSGASVQLPLHHSRLLPVRPTPTPTPPPPPSSSYHPTWCNIVTASSYPSDLHLDISALHQF